MSKSPEMTDPEIKAALAILMTVDGKGKRVKADAFERLLLDAAQYGPVAALVILQAELKKQP